MEGRVAEIDRDKVVALLNAILEQELAGVVRYTHYSLLVFGFGRIPIVAWLREQATESLQHAHQAGEMITQSGAYPSLAIGPLLDSHKTDISTEAGVMPGLCRAGSSLASTSQISVWAEG
jgi:bacterioferritin